MEKFSVDNNKCIRCGMCTGIAPEIFEFDDEGNNIKVNNEIINEENIENVNNAKNNCPVEAISSSNE